MCGGLHRCVMTAPPVDQHVHKSTHYLVKGGDVLLGEARGGVCKRVGPLTYGAAQVDWCTPKQQHRQVRRR